MLLLIDELPTSSSADEDNDDGGDSRDNEGADDGDSEDNERNGGGEDDDNEGNNDGDINDEDELSSVLSCMGETKTMCLIECFR